MSIPAILLPALLILLFGVGLIMFLDVAFSQSTPRTQRSPLPLRCGRDLRDWASIRGRIVAEKWLKTHPGPVDGAALARELEQTSSDVVTAAFQLPRGSRESAQRCLDPHGSPRVSIPETLAILQDVQRNRPAELNAIRQRVSDNLATGTSLRPDGAANVVCPLVTNGGMCVCTMSRPLPCRGRCVAGCDDSPVAAEAAAWAQTLGEGLIAGACEALEPLGVDAGRYELNRALASLLEQPDAAARWNRGERICTSPTQIAARQPSS